MKKKVLGIIILFYISPLFADNTECMAKIPGYKVVKHSVYPFFIGNEKACFFSFYTANPEQIPTTRGSGNLSKFALWYGYFKNKKPFHVQELPKPSDSFWGAVCHLEAVSFYDMNEDGKRDITVIGSCNEYNEIKYRYPFVFIWDGTKYIFNNDVYTNLFGFIGLSIADIRSYIINPPKYYKILRNKYKFPGTSLE